jgi:hypothetical protein
MINENEMGGAYRTHGEMRNTTALQLVSLKISRKPRLSREDNIKMDLLEIGMEVVEWIYLSQYSH